MKYYIQPNIAVLRRSMNVMAGLDLYSETVTGGQLGNEATFDQPAAPAQPKNVWDE